MGILADFEDSIGKVIEGTFGGIFRSHVQPAEIARACAKEMDRSKKLGVGKVYAANFYTVILSPRDGDALGGLMTTLGSELETYLRAHCRKNNYHLTTHPIVHFVTDEHLRLGRFEAFAETMSQEEIDRELGVDSALHKRADQPPAPASVPEAPPARYPAATSTPSGGAATLTTALLGTIALGGRNTYTIGRKETCDIQLDDSAASRLHATLTRDDLGWVVTDNEATNTTKVNGAPITRRLLNDGDIITIGTTQLTYRNAGGMPTDSPNKDNPYTSPPPNSLFSDSFDPDVFDQEVDL